MHSCMEFKTLKRLPSLHFFNISQNRYRNENPGTLVGMPGKYQGLNSGVALLDLNKMRRSDMYKLGSELN